MLHHWHSWFAIGGEAKGRRERRRKKDGWLESMVLCAALGSRGLLNPGGEQPRQLLHTVVWWGVAAPIQYWTAHF